MRAEFGLAFRSAWADWFKGFVGERRSVSGKDPNWISLANLGLILDISCFSIIETGSCLIEV